MVVGGEAIPTHSSVDKSKKKSKKKEHKPIEDQYALVDKSKKKKKKNEPDATYAEVDMSKKSIKVCWPTIILWIVTCLINEVVCFYLFILLDHRQPNILTSIPLEHGTVKGKGWRPGFKKRHMKKLQFSGWSIKRTNASISCLSLSLSLFLNSQICINLKGPVIKSNWLHLDKLYSILRAAL